MPREAAVLTGKTEKAKYTVDEFGSDPTSNTVKLRKKFTEYAVEKQSAGEPSKSFHEWAKENYPNVPILNPR